MKWLNLSLLVLFPLSWFAPLMRAGLLPLFGLDEISVYSGVVSLWDSDPLLGLIVIVLAMVLPILKTVALSLMDFGFLSTQAARAISVLGKFAMADVFLVALYIVIVKGVGLATVETAWGLYFFTACILLSLTLSAMPRSRA